MLLSRGCPRADACLSACRSWRCSAACPPSSRCSAALARRTRSSTAGSKPWEPDADSPQSAEDVRELYDKWADTYEETLSAWGWDGPARVAEAYTRHGGLTDAILDVGCGTGLSALELRTVGCVGDIVGLDISEQSLSIARAKTYSTGDSGDSSSRGVFSRTVCADITDGTAVPLATGSFDGLTCVGSIFYMTHAYDATFSEWRRLLRPGGVCVLSQTVEWQTDEFFAALTRHGLTIEEQSAPSDLHPHNETYQSRPEQQVSYFVCRTDG